jgi:hypothetical protein
MSDTKKLRVGWHKEHFLSPLLQFHAEDVGETFELVECPGGTGEMQVKLKNGEIDLCIGELGNVMSIPCDRTVLHLSSGVIRKADLVQL